MFFSIKLFVCVKNKTIIVIVTYNALNWLTRCLESCGEVAVIVVDNNSQDGTDEFIKTNYPKIELIPKRDNLGFGRANNIGIKEALRRGADQIFLLNQDAYLESDTVEQLTRAASQNPEYGILSPIHLDGSGKRLDRNFTNYIHYDNNKDFFSDALFKRLAGIYEVPFVNAACWLLPKKTLETIGGFDPIFFHYGEDDNYCQRVLFHRMKIGVVSGCYVRHDRENRQQNYPKNADFNAWLKKEELRYKVTGADINRDPYYTKSIMIQLRVLLIDFLFFRISKIHNRIKYIKSLKRWRYEVIQSRSKNKLIGQHYLN